MVNLWIPTLLLIGSMVYSQDTEKPAPPDQPAAGPGGQNYVHAEVKFSDHARRPDGFWLFEPASPVPENAPVVVFHHGYGAINPMIYGAWIRHIVRQGNIVIHPRYQKNLFFPSSKHFVPNAAKGIQSALKLLSEEAGRVRPDTNAFLWRGTVTAVPLQRILVPATRNWGFRTRKGYYCAHPVPAP